MVSYNRVAIIGLGLIGSSVARALRKSNIAQTIVACDENEVSLGYSRKNGFIDIATTDPAFAARGAEIVLIATPLHALESVATAIAGNLMENALVMDVASVKQPAVDAIAPHMPAHCVFIPAHPIAGSEKTGASAGKADLFTKKRVIITPESPLGPAEMQRASEFWQALGARIEAMPPLVHDRIYGYVSHLPQLLAFAAAQTLLVTDDELMLHPMLQGFLRLSLSDKKMWADLFIYNIDNMFIGLDRYLDVISHVIQELKSAPAGEESGGDSKLARLVLFPRIVSSCLITTVMEAEKNASISMARYAGAGFVDFTSPATKTPEEDTENISEHYLQVAMLLDTYRDILDEIRNAIGRQDAKTLTKLL